MTLVVIPLVTERQRAHNEGKLTPFEQDLKIARTSGFVQMAAVNGPHRCRIYRRQSEDGYQNELHEWSEACDKIHTQHLIAITEHLPEHIPAVATGANAGDVRCETCPVMPEMPNKPIRPYERF